MGGLFKNVVVLCTGRCGSKVFVQACSRMTNYTAGHETCTKLVGPARMAWPSFHIEADCRLCWMTGRLDREWGGTPFYVHLTRDPRKVAASYGDRWHSQSSLLPFYVHNVLVRVKGPPSRRCRNTRLAWMLEAGLDCVDTMEANIRLFLRDKPNQMEFPIERADDLFPVFWRRIGAEGDLDAALREFRRSAEEQKH